MLIAPALLAQREINTTLNSKDPLEVRLKKAISHSIMALEYDEDAILKIALHNNPKVAAQIKPLIEKLDHIGFIIPSECNLFDVHAAAHGAGFKDQIILDSTVLAAHLAQLIQSKQFVTKILKSRKECGKGIEFFIPYIDSGYVTEWIEKGVGNHFALRLKNKEDFDRIDKIILHETEGFPVFTTKKPYKNPDESVQLMYYKCPVDGQEFIIEFFFQV